MTEDELVAWLRETGALRALEAVRSAIEQLKGANSDEARDAAQQAVLAAGEALDEALGVTAVQRDRMLAAIGDEAPWRQSHETEFEPALIARLEAGTRAGRNALRRVFGRHLLDSPRLF